MKTPGTIQKSITFEVIAMIITDKILRGVRTTALLAALFGVSAAGGIAFAGSVTVPDYSFENTVLAIGATTAAPHVGTNWTASGNGAVFLRNPNGTNDFLGAPPLPAPADGSNYVRMGLAAPGYCWQDLGLGQSNTVYTLTVAAGQTITNGSGVGRIALVDGVNPFIGTLLASAPVDTSLVTTGAFANFTLVYTTGQKAPKDLCIVLFGDSGIELCWDNVRLDATAAPLTPTAVPPVVSPSNTVFIGTIVTLTEDPAGTLPLHYQWQSDNGSGGVTFTDIGGANNTTNLINTSGFTPGSPVEYQVVVTNSSGASTSAPVSVDAINGIPIIVADTLPASGSDVVGSSVTFSAVMDGTRPITYQWQVDNGGGPTDISGATNTTYTLTNLQVTDTAVYSLNASNLFGVTPSTGRAFIVSPTPPATNNVIVSYANQTGLGGFTLFTPSWTVSSNNSLIAGQLPSTVGPGNFSDPNGGAGVVAVLTDGKYGTLYPAGNGSLDFITGGTAGSGAGQFVTYTLPASTTGWDVTNILSYGGWSDAGRDQQRYVLYYSTVASPTVFNQLIDVSFNPADSAGAQSGTRATLTAATGTAIAKNVAALKFDFSTLNNGVENGYAGYSEIQVFGVASAPAPVVSTNTSPTSGSDVVGSQVTFKASFSSATPVVYQWTKDTGGGPVPINGATNTTLTLTNLQLSDSASVGYSLQASNASGISSSTASPFSVSSAPSPDTFGSIDSPANQTGPQPFATTWTVAPGSLIAGRLPSSTGQGNFEQEGCFGPPVLTDGKIGPLGGGAGNGNTNLATCGISGGSNVVFTLSDTGNGYDLTNVVTYGGWNDGGRDAIRYTLYYSSVTNPAIFIPIANVNYNPTLTVAGVSADRVTVTSSAGGPLATNVARVMFDFTSPTAENNYAGVSEIQLFGQHSSSAPAAFGPVLTTNTVPSTASDVVGSSVTFVALFTSSSPIDYQWMKDTGAGPGDVPAATSPTLTLNNLQLSDAASGGYSLRASNILGVVTSTPSPLTVNAVPGASGNIIAINATQTGNGVQIFNPTWTVAPGNLIAGQLPTFTVGNFLAQAGNATSLAVLTDGQFGNILSPGSTSPTLVAAGSGNASTTRGNVITYTLTGSTTGYTLTNVVVYTGWSDSGRDAQHYIISYSTVANPTTFILVGSNYFNPTVAAAHQSTIRGTIKSATSAPLATNVYAVSLVYSNTPAVENTWTGQGEIQLFGFPTAPVITINSTTLSGGNLILKGTGGAAGAGYTWLTSTNVAAPLSAWTTNTTGVFDLSGGFSNAIPITSSEPGRFFWLRTP